MSKRYLSAAPTAAIATGATTKTLLNIAAASNHAIAIWEFCLSFQGTARNTPVQCQAVRQDGSGTGTSLTLVEMEDEDPETTQTTAKHTLTVEPTTTEILMQRAISPDNGIWEWVALKNEPMVVNGGEFWGLRTIAANDVNVIVWALIEE